MAARSTTQGTPVKSCSRTRLGVKAISLSGFDLLFQPARARTSSLVTLRPSSVRSRFSSRMRRENGQMFGGDALFIESVEAVDFVFFAADFESGAGIETVHRHDGLPLGMTGALETWERGMQLNSVMLLSGMRRGEPPPPRRRLSADCPGRLLLHKQLQKLDSRGGCRYADRCGVIEVTNSHGIFYYSAATTG